MGLPGAAHPRQPAEREGGGERGGETLDRFSFIWQSAEVHHTAREKRSPMKPFEHTRMSGIKEEERAFSFFHGN